MNTKECIEFLTFQKKESGFKESIEKFNKKIDEIIKRLQMWEEFKENNGSVWGYGKGKYISELMSGFEEKYFPKKELIR